MPFCLADEQDNGRVCERQGPQPPADREWRVHQGRFCAVVPAVTPFHVDLCVQCFGELL